MTTLEQTAPGDLLDRDLRRFCTTADARTPLLSERRLAQRYGITHAAVRRVLDQLMDEGLIQREQGRGTFVAKRETATSQTLMIVDTTRAIEHPYFAGRLQGIMAAARELGYAIEIASSPPLATDHFFQQISRAQVQGVLLPWISTDLIDKVRRRNPHVAIMTTNPQAIGMPVCRVLVDYYAWGAMAADYLLRRGCRRPFAVCHTRAAADGFRGACENAGVTPQISRTEMLESDHPRAWQQFAASQADGLAIDDEYATRDFCAEHALPSIPIISQATRGSDAQLPPIALLTVDSHQMGRTIVQTFHYMISYDSFLPCGVMIPPTLQEPDA